MNPSPTGPKANGVYAIAPYIDMASSVDRGSR